MNRKTSSTADVSARPDPSADGLTEEDIVERVFDAVIDQRLPPGSKLSESALCDVFGVGRMRIRRALLLLASREVVDIVSHRGAFVASPSAKQAQDVFEARLAIEPSVAKLAAICGTSTEIATLEAHLASESMAYEQSNRRDVIRLSGQFHVVLAQIAGNEVLLRTIKELVTRTTLIIGLYGAPGITACRDHDHRQLLDVLSAGDEEAAARLMRVHLEEIRSRIDLDAPLTTPADLRTVFS